MCVYGELFLAHAAIFIMGVFKNINVNKKLIKAIGINYDLRLKSSLDNSYCSQILGFQHW